MAFGWASLFSQPYNSGGVTAVNPQPVGGGGNISGPIAIPGGAVMNHQGTYGTYPGSNPRTSIVPVNFSYRSLFSR